MPHCCFAGSAVLDAHLQMGHVLKLLGRPDEALIAHERSCDIEPCKAAFDEINRFRVIDEPDRVDLGARTDPTDTVYFEIDDLLDYLRTHKTPSGIQRVQAGILRVVATRTNAGSSSQAFVRTGRYGQGYWWLDPADLQAIIDYVSGHTTDQTTLFSTIEFAEQRAVNVSPTKGQSYFILGAFWGFASDPSRYRKLRSQGVLVGIYIYDLIPITHPEYCAVGLVNEFTLALGDGLASFDFISTISNYVAGEVHCLFTTFPSIVEGWGLPVGESLTHDRACVASKSSLIPEAGGDLSTMSTRLASVTVSACFGE